MKKHLLLVAAAAAIATPAVAQDAGPYIGIEGGVLFPRDTEVDASVDFIDPLQPDVVYNDVFDLDYKTGFDIDGIIGYDFGMFRLEGELGYKRAKVDEIELDQSFIEDYEDATGVDLSNVDFDLDGTAKVTSAMVNGLVDFDAGGVAVYAGGGIGRAWVRLLGDRDSAWAYQFIAGARAPVTNNIDVGVKYRYFRTGSLDFSGNANFTDADILLTNDSKFSSHSLLASLIFNFGAPAPAPAYVPTAAPPPPPPPAPPATQTCPDGTVILATEICPAPPPPPPPPPPAPERG
jgi:opacity protein-like surface antigen